MRAAAFVVALRPVLRTAGLRPADFATAFFAIGATPPWRVIALAYAAGQLVASYRLSDAAVNRAWKTAVRLIDVDGRTERERQQLNYARKILRQAIVPRKVA